MTTNSTTDSASPRPPVEPETGSLGPRPPGETEQTAADGLSPAQRAKHYQRRRMALGVGEWAVEVLLLIVLLVSGGSVAIREAAERASGNPWVVVLLYLLPLGALFSMVSMVFGAVRAFVVDRRFGLSTQTFRIWLADELKSAALGGLLALVLVEIVYGLLRLYPESWWIGVGVAVSVLSIVLAHLAPVLIFPLFYRFTRISDTEIAERLAQLASHAQTRIEGVYEFNFSRKTRAANAALVGFGRTRRIVLADNLLDNFTLDELEAVLAHEFAHHTQHHLPKIIAIQTAMYFVLFYGLHRVLGLVDGRWGFRGTADVANLPLLALGATVLVLILLPLTNGLLRHFERQADAYALRIATQPAAFISALQRLAQINLADRSPHPLIEWIFYSHPSIGKRIACAEKALEAKQ
jgi:STE24 endopeptidase